MLKWYVDRITEAERQEHIQEVLKVITRPLKTDESLTKLLRDDWRLIGSSAQTVIGGDTLLTFQFKNLNQFMTAPGLMKLERDFARPVHRNLLRIKSCRDDVQDGQERWEHEKRLE